MLEVILRSIVATLLKFVYSVSDTSSIKPVSNGKPSICNRKQGSDIKPNAHESEEPSDGRPTIKQGKQPGSDQALKNYTSDKTPLRSATDAVVSNSRFNDNF